MKVKAFVLSLTFAASLTATAQAIPALGVATSTGEYAYIDGKPSETSYIFDILKQYQNPPVVEKAINGAEGFVVGPSGTSELVVFVQVDKNDDKNYPVYLMTNMYDGAFGCDVRYGGQQFTSVDGFIGDKFKAYHVDPAAGSYYGLLLPSLEDHIFWDVIDYGEFDDGKKVYVSHAAVVEYAGAFEMGDYFFALADSENPPAGPSSGDYVSPRTTSAGGFYGEPTPPVNPVPEPASMMLLGTGLLGFAVIRFKKK